MIHINPWAGLKYVNYPGKLGTFFVECLAPRLPLKPFIVINFTFSTSFIISIIRISTNLYGEHTFINWKYVNIGLISLEGLNERMPTVQGLYILKIFSSWWPLFWLSSSLTFPWPQRNFPDVLIMYLVKTDTYIKSKEWQNIYVQTTCLNSLTFLFSLLKFPDFSLTF